MPTPNKQPVTPEVALRRRRLTRIRDYAQAALDQADPLRGNLQACSAELMEIALLLKTAIDEALLDEANLLQRFKEIGPLVDMFLKFHRQIDRYAQLDRHLVAAGRDEEGGFPVPERCEKNAN